MKIVLSAILTLFTTPAWAAPFLDTRPSAALIAKFTFVIIALMLVKAVLSSRYFKGKWGERSVRRLIDKELDSATYHAIHDVTLPAEGGTTQIDHVIVSRFGIFVVETKNMGGWIFGREFDPKWTQTFGSHKNSFQNPLRQNYRHIKTLDTLLDVGEHKIFSIVAFTGGSTLKSDMPENVVHGRQLIDYVTSKYATLLSESEVRRIIRSIEDTMLERSADTDRQHVRNLSAKHGQSARKTGLHAGRLTAVAALLFSCTGAAALYWPTQPDTPPEPLIIPAAYTPPQSAPDTPVPANKTAPNQQRPRSSEYGFLSLAAGMDSHVTLYDADNVAVVRLDIRKGQTETVKIRKGIYKAEILQDGKREISSVSFIGDTGVLEF